MEPKRAGQKKFSLASGVGTIGMWLVCHVMSPGSHPAEDKTRRGRVRERERERHLYQSIHPNEWALLSRRGVDRWHSDKGKLTQLLPLGIITMSQLQFLSTGWFTYMSHGMCVAESFILQVKRVCIIISCWTESAKLKSTEPNSQVWNYNNYVALNKE